MTQSLTEDNLKAQSKKQTRKRIITFIENRAINFPSVTEFSATAKECGWGFCHLTAIDSDQLSLNKLHDVPLDFVILRSAENDYQETQRLICWLNKNNKITININNKGGYACSADKHYQQGLYLLDPLLKPYALPTFDAKNKAHVLACVKEKLVHFPILLKVRNGTTGKGITLINSESDLNYISNFQNYAIEQYIEPECDFRVFVMGGVAVGIMQKYGDPKNPSDFQAWSGGRKKERVKDLKLIDELSEIATRACAANHTEYGGIDIIKEKKTGKLYILEDNTCAGWLNVPASFHFEIPKRMIEWMGIVADGREMSFANALKSYLKSYDKYLPIRIQKTIMEIKKAKPDILEPYQKIFDTYPQDHLYDAGYLFNHLREAYDAITKTGIPPKDLPILLREIEHMPFSWAGNFIGPEVGTFHDGAILSALYLFLCEKLAAVS